MDIYENWNKALKQTEIVRTRIQPLMTFSDTQVPYILLSESVINVGDTVVRSGKVVVQKPSIILPPNVPQFEGFEFEQNSGEEDVLQFLFLRGVSVPSYKYNNQTYSLGVHEGKMSDALKHYNNQLQRKEDVHTGLVVGPEDCWQFSLLIFICSQVVKNADSDIKKLLDEYKNKNK